MGMLLRFMPWPLWAGLGAVGLGAIVAGALWGAVEFGIKLRAVKVDKMFAEDVAKKREINFQVDRETIQNDARVVRALEENEALWKTTETPSIASPKKLPQLSQPPSLP